jgi:hypothetical protein
LTKIALMITVGSVVGLRGNSRRVQAFSWTCTVPKTDGTTGLCCATLNLYYLVVVDIASTLHMCTLP